MRCKNYSAGTHLVPINGHMYKYQKPDESYSKTDSESLETRWTCKSVPLSVLVLSHDAIEHKEQLAFRLPFFRPPWWSWLKNWAAAYSRPTGREGICANSVSPETLTMAWLFNCARPAKLALGSRSVLRPAVGWFSVILFCFCAHRSSLSCELKNTNLATGRRSVSDLSCRRSLAGMRRGFWFFFWCSRRSNVVGHVFRKEMQSRECSSVTWHSFVGGLRHHTRCARGSSSRCENAPT